jgi:cysteine synthase
LYLNNCIGCHTGMDPLAGAFAYYNFNEMTGSIEYTQGNVQPKYFNNDTNFETGYRTTDDSWINYWREGQNGFLGWATSGPGSAGSGMGAKSMGDELANSAAFASCQVKKVFKAVCLREPENQADRDQVNLVMIPSFQAGYSMKQTFAEAAVYCMGQ